jgi:hypothetical protein
MPDRRAGTPVLFDVLWGQYCLYLFGRLLDDELDLQLHSIGLRRASAKFEEEAKAVFRRVVGPSKPFWRSYARCVHGAKRAFYRVDKLQRKKNVAPSTILREYAKVSAIFQVAPAALCSVFGKPSQFYFIRRYMQHLALFAQTLDDLVDLWEDFENGRLNYVARLLRQAAQTRRIGGDSWQQLVAAYCCTDTVPRIFDSLQLHIRLAASTIAPLKSEDLNSLCLEYDKSVKQLYAEVEKERTELFMRRVFAASKGLGRFR